MTDAVLLDNVKKVYPGAAGTVALKGISLNIAEGEFASIVGPSGSGKTTLLSVIGTLDKPTSGKVYIGGKDTTGMTDDELSKIRNIHIGFIFQSYNLINRLTALENVSLPLVVRGVNSSERYQLATKALNDVGLSSMVKRKPSELSGGEQQRVAIARALVTNPTIILADEPTGNLDSKNAENIMNVLTYVNKTMSKTIIMVTHNMDLAKMTKKIIQLKDGMIERVEQVN
ncbi:MAG: ABC transporter ATP-binding protein [Nitrososphaerota archaeon]|nr:ABC transporter ATP-binding protein [Nitrososphaerota archaeon]MDG6927712.1 ABC transporter ATP-binding protein [Nitrososphaerota archaeon]MDG6930179.1 ABC transporter ATP-binding protein [Nitrososphaerota archaeon]MDG6932052.1 ABC transporter ATP-binding protein [Nitrososphaerota archaeon]MDG6935427.1 ABC transporter ATP-binding protein [Nitrososphaerota archaeon]